MTRSLFTVMWCLLVSASTNASAGVSFHASGDQGRKLEQTTAKAGARTVRAWTTDHTAGPLVFRAENGVAIPESGELYVKIDYIDAGYGEIRVHLQDEQGGSIAPDRFLNLTRTDSGEVVSARMRMSGARKLKNDRMVVRIERADGDDAAIGIVGVTVQETPFDAPKFQFVISDPWKGPYQGPTVRPAENTTLRGKVMTGYQGWYRTPNDPDGRGWVHWGDIRNGRFSIDQWPDVSEYPQADLAKAADIRLKSGKQAYLFSSAWPSSVDTHFRWMRENEIDGAFLQRFVSDNFHSISGKPEWVLANVRAAANREGRIWAVEYDISGYPDAKLLETLKRDWKWFIDDFKLLNDPNYAREGEKPVVFIWGLPFPNRNISPETANAVVDFFKNDPEYGGNYVIGGIPGNWRHMDAAWQDHFQKYEGVLSWMSQSYAEDITDFGKLGIDYYAHAKPGFSWANLKHLPTGDDTVDYTPRDGGRHYWNQIKNAADAGADRLFVGMFDEYDEATAIMPMSDDPPPTPARPGVAATFYDGDRPQESGHFELLESAEVPFGTSPPSNRATTENFFVRMGGRITFPAAGTYTFAVESAANDDVELFINGTSVLHGAEIDGPVWSGERFTVKAGESVAFRLQCRHRTGKGTLRLMWGPDAGSQTPVPADALHDAWGRFITNEGRKPDWWMELTKKGKKLILRNVESSDSGSTGESPN